MRRVTPGAMATLVYVVFDVETATLRFANAGHPPPLVRRADGTASFLDQVSAQPLGVAEYAAFEEGDDALEAGSALLLCTDGLIERRSESFEAGLARLADTVLSGPEAPSDLCDHVLAATVPATGGEDDVAIVVLHALPPPGERMQLRLAADPDELADIRRLLGRWLHIFQAEPDEAYEITVACTEACANAIEHAYSPGEASFELEALLRDGEVAITVRDAGRWRPPRGHHRGRGLQIMESFMDAVDVTRDDAGTTVQLRRRLAGRAA